MRVSSLPHPAEAAAKQDDTDVLTAARAIMRGIVAGAVVWGVLLAASTALFVL